MKSTTVITLGALIDQCGGELFGSPEISVSGIAPLADATPQQISFLSNSKLRKQAASSQAAALIVTQADHAELQHQYAGAFIVCANPYVYFARAAQWFASRVAIPAEVGVHPRAWVDPQAKVAASASIAANVSIGPECVIGEGVCIHPGVSLGRGVIIGDNSIIYPNVTIYDYCEIGPRCIIHAGAVIGADGFGFANEKGRWIKIPQTGRVLIANDVEIGANTTIDRGAMADTIIEEGVILDNQIQIGHNCRIGAFTAMAGCVGVAGSATIGKHCTFGGAAMVLGHLTIVDNVHISSASMVSRSILEPGQYTGFYPLAKNADWEKGAVLVRNISSMRDRLRELEKIIKTKAD